MQALRRIGEQRDILGECPLWDNAAQVLYWVDIRKPAITRHVPTTGQTDTWDMPAMVGAIALTDGPDLLVALGTRIALWEIGTSRFTTIAELPNPISGHRFNDGCTDRQGRFWVGTMHNDTRAPEGTLFRLESGMLTPVLTGISIPNSLAWSPDGETMYFADSLRYCINAYPFNLGQPGPPQRFATSSAPAFPDGAVTDVQGHLWYAEFFGGRIVRRAPDGSLSQVIETPVERPTALTFGGSDLRTLYITTTCQNMTPDACLAAPLAGALLAVDVDVQGLPEPRVALAKAAQKERL